MSQQPITPRGPTRKFKCLNCGYEFELPYGVPRPMQCPKCGAPVNAIVRVDRGAGRGRGQRRGFCRGFKQQRW